MKELGFVVMGHMTNRHERRWNWIRRNEKTREAWKEVKNNFVKEHLHHVTKGRGSYEAYSKKIERGFQFDEKR